MKIIAVEIFPSSQRGGSEKAFFEVLLALKSLGHEIALAYCQEGDLVSLYEAAGINTFKISATNIQNWFAIKTYYNLYQSATQIKSLHPDLLYINYLGDTPLAALLKIFYGIPSICHIRIPYMGSSKQFSFGARYVNAFIVFNQKMKTEYEEKEHLKNVYVINDSILVPSFTKKKERKPAAVYLGRLSPEKGLKELIKVWRILRDQYQINYPLVMIGPVYSEQEKAYAQELSEMISAYQLDSIKILAPVSNPIESLSEYHFAVLPSLLEAFGRVIPESIMAGTPIFARNVGMTAEILGPQKLDLIFDSEEDLAQKISLFLKGEIKINMVALKQHIIDHYSIEKNISAIESQMLDILN